MPLSAPRESRRVRAEVVQAGCERLSSRAMWSNR